MIVENTQDLTLTQRIERMLVCAGRIERFSRNLREELHLGNLPFDDNPYDYYDKDVSQGLAILEIPDDAVKIALNRAQELSGHTQEAV